MGSAILFPTITIREGQTDRITCQLLADDVAINLEGIHHVELELRDMKRNTYRYSSLAVGPKVGISEAANGKVYLDPPSSLFKQLLSPYLLYWLVYDDVTTWYSCPEDIEAIIQVRKNW